MAEKYVGAVVMELDGQEIECVSIDAQVDTGRAPVKTMNRSGRVKGHSNGVKTWSLTVEVAIPLDGAEPDWEGIEDVRITIYPIGHDDRRQSYTGCSTTRVSQAYKVEGNAVRRLEVFALDHITE